MTPLVLWNEHIITCSSALFKGILTAILKTLDEYLKKCTMDESDPLSE